MALGKRVGSRWFRAGVFGLALPAGLVFGTAGPAFGRWSVQDNPYVVGDSFTSADGREGGEARRERPDHAPRDHGPRHHGPHGPAHHEPGGRTGGAGPGFAGRPDRETRPPAHGPGGGRHGGGRTEASKADAISSRLREAGLGAHAIAVWHEDGHVTLDGRVESGDAKRRAERLARSIDGVRDVENRLRVDLGGRDDGRSEREPASRDRRPESVPPGHGPDPHGPKPHGPDSHGPGGPPHAEKVVGDVTVNVEVNVNVNSGNTLGPAGVPQRAPFIPEELRPPRPREVGPPDRGRGPDGDPAAVRELHERVRRLQAELEETRRRPPGAEGERREPREETRGPREQFERMRREMQQRAEEARERLQQQFRRQGEERREGAERRDAEDNRRERGGESREEDREDDEDGGDEDRRDREDDRRAEGLPTSSLFQAMFEGLNGLAF